MAWQHATSEGVSYHKFYRPDQRVFSESNDQADWGNWYWATKDQSGVSSPVDHLTRGLQL